MIRTLAALFVLVTAFAALAAPMTNEDVIRMVKGGLGDETVMQAIDGAEPGFDTSPEGLVRLKQGGASDKLIQHILGRKGGASAAAICKDCGTITAIREIDKPGRATGVGAIAGGVVGAVVGRNVAGRDDRTAGTVVGAAGGALAGHMIEKHARSGKTWEIAVRLDDGTSRVFLQDTHPSWSAGTRVRVVNGALAPL